MPLRGRAGGPRTRLRRRETLATLAGSVLRGQKAIPALLERSREAFGMESVALLERAVTEQAELDHAELERAAVEPGRAARGGNGAGWRLVAAAGPRPCTAPGEGDAIVAATGSAVLALRGRVLPASDQRVLTAFAAQVGVALEQARLAEAAAAAKPLAEAHRMRTALLAAVSHDLRTPLASAKAAVTSLRSHDVDWSRGGFRRTARHRGRVAGPADPHGGEPAGHEPAAGRRAQPGRAAGHAR